MAAFDYMTRTPNFGLAFEQMQAANLERQQAEAKRQEALQMQQVLQQIGPNASPMEYVSLVQQFPNMREPLTAQYNAMDDARKNAAFDAGQQAFVRLRQTAEGGIDATAAVAKLRESAEAFRNSNMADMADQFDKYAEGVERDPTTARKSIGMLLAFVNPDKFKKVNDTIGANELTTFQKDLSASGIDPASDEGRQFSRQYVINRADPIVTMETPSGAQFIGPMSEYQRRYGQAADPGRKLPVPKSRAEFDALPSGAQFVAPDGSVRKKP